MKSQEKKQRKESPEAVYIGSKDEIAFSEFLINKIKSAKELYDDHPFAMEIMFCRGRLHMGKVTPVSPEGEAFFEDEEE